MELTKDIIIDAILGNNVPYYLHDNRKFCIFHADSYGEYAEWNSDGLNELSITELSEFYDSIKKHVEYIKVKTMGGPKVTRSWDGTHKSADEMMKDLLCASYDIKNKKR